MKNNNKQGGAIANKNGKILEKFCCNLFEEYDYPVFQYKDRNKIENENKYVIKNVPYTSIYNHKSKTEYLLVNKNHDLRIRIECKWQQTAGSVDEKIPYLYLNCVQCFPEQNIIILLDGGGYKKGAKIWLENSIKNNLMNVENKNIKLFNQSDFTKWMNAIHKND